MWGGSPWGTLPWGALPIPTTTAGPAAPNPVTLAHVDGQAPSPSIEGREPAMAIEGREPALWLPTMRVGG